MKKLLLALFFLILFLTRTERAYAIDIPQMIGDLFPDLQIEVVINPSPTPTKTPELTITPTITPTPSQPITVIPPIALPSITPVITDTPEATPTITPNPTPTPLIPIGSADTDDSQPTVTPTPSPTQNVLASQVQNNDEPPVVPNILNNPIAAIEYPITLLEKTLPQELYKGSSVTIGRALNLGIFSILLIIMGVWLIKPQSFRQLSGSVGIQSLIKQTGAFKRTVFPPVFKKEKLFQ